MPNPRMIEVIEVIEPRCRIAVLLVCTLVACAAVGCPQIDATPESPPEPSVTIRKQQVAVEVMRTPKEQALGLGKRDTLDWDRGMLFVYDKPRILTFWMKEMRFDIDIVWIRGDRIVGIDEFVPYPREDPAKPATVRAPEVTDMVLEVPAGYARARAWRPGDRVTARGVTPTTPAGN